MKKSFPLVSERHKSARVVEQVKGEIRKYLKRERSKKLPEDFDFWDFDCKTGREEGVAIACHEKEIGARLDQALSDAWPQIYLEVLAKPVKRNSRKKENEA